MEQPRTVEHDSDPAQNTYPDMPNHAGNEAEFLALVDEGLADIEVGRTVPFETVSVNLRRRMYGQA